MKKFRKIISFFYGLKLKYLFSRSIVVAYGDIRIGKNVKISNSKIIIDEYSSLIIGDNCQFDKVLVSLKGQAVFGQGNIIEQKGTREKLEIVGEGQMFMGDCNRIRSKIWIRFGGKIEIGSYTNINEGSEVRCDEQVFIGSYNQISYNVIIWDTNTHNVYSAEKRRILAENYYPFFGMEHEKPDTKPIFIGNDCWLGKDVAILKGTTVKDSCIVGFRTLLSNTIIEKNTTVFQELSTKQYRNSI